jgi:hypothetical protein
MGTRKRFEEDEIDLENFEKLHSCQHVFHDGNDCLNVADPYEHFCRWHKTSADREARRITYSKRRNKNAIRDLNLPMIEDAESLQLAIHEVLDAIIDGRANDRRAGHLLYGLQISQNNIKDRLHFTRMKYSVFNLMNDLEEALEKRKAIGLAQAPRPQEKKKSPESAPTEISKANARVSKH